MLSSLCSKINKEILESIGNVNIIFKYIII
jgi:hypothetical protein